MRKGGPRYQIAERAVSDRLRGVAIFRHVLTQRPKDGDFFRIQGGHIQLDMELIFD